MLLSTCVCTRIWMCISNINGIVLLFRLMGPAWILHLCTQIILMTAQGSIIEMDYDLYGPLLSPGILGCYPSQGMHSKRCCHWCYPITRPQLSGFHVYAFMEKTLVVSSHFFTLLVLHYSAMLRGWKSEFPHADFPLQILLTLT